MTPNFSRKLSVVQDRLGLRSRGELGAAALFFVGELGVRIWAIFSYRFNSDEPQHLHVIWAWTHGLVQYRDVFDNHMPLFHIMCAPILGLLGEHADALYGMRFLVMPLYFLSAWCIFRIGRIAFSARVGTWSVVASGAIWSYALCTTEFRPDDLWVLFWLMTVLVLLRKAMGWHGATVAGLLLGLAFAVSMKSTLMLLTICLAFVATMLLFVPAKSLLKRLPKTNIFAFIACGAVPPLLVAVFFAAKGVWPEFRDCVFEHNVGSGAWPRDAALHLVLLPVGLPLVMRFALRAVHGSVSSIGVFRRAFLVNVCGIYLVLLSALWHNITHQDYLPFYPLASTLAVAALLRWQERRNTRKSIAPGLGSFSLPATALLVMFMLLLIQVRLRDRGTEEVALVRNVLTLTTPDDSVFDSKGESVFRQRCTYEVFESLTNRRIKNHLMADDVPEHCMESKTCLAVLGPGLTDKDSQFLKSNYLPVGGELLVAGKYLVPETARSIEFTVEIPADYEVVTRQGMVAGLLDGTPYTGERFLDQGIHTFRPVSGAQTLAVIWARAAQHHFTPWSQPLSPLDTRKGHHFRFG